MLLSEYSLVCQLRGNYFGGITYRKECGTLEPGQTVKVEAPHFTKDSQIVRYSWNDS